MVQRSSEQNPVAPLLPPQTKISFVASGEAFVEIMSKSLLEYWACRHAVISRQMDTKNLVSGAFICVLGVGATSQFFQFARLNAENFDKIHLFKKTVEESSVVKLI